MSTNAAAPNENPTTATDRGVTERATRAADLAEKILDTLVAAKGGARRDGQVLMARDVAQSCTRSVPFLVEGSTGVGKSLAYLAGAVAYLHAAGHLTEQGEADLEMADRPKIVIATHTKALQDQLLGDLELLVSALDGSGLLPRTPEYAVLKGRANYVCVRKTGLDTDEPDTEIGAAPTEVAAVHSELGKTVLKLRDWAAQPGHDGERKSVPFDVDNRAWAQVSMSSSNCRGKKCEVIADCFAEHAKLAARTADIVIVNQALLGLYMQFPGILGEKVEAIIVDEAHEFEQVVAETFGASITARHLRALASTARIIPDSDTLRSSLENAIDELDKALPTPTEPDRTAPESEQITAALEFVQDQLARLGSAANNWTPGNQDQEGQKDRLIRALKAAHQDCRVVLGGNTDQQVVWLDTVRDEPVLRAAQFDVAERMKTSLLDTVGSVIFTSATLQVAGTFDLPARRYGFTQLERPWTHRVVPSPFNYRDNGLVWQPTGMPDVKADDYNTKAADVIADVITAAGGRTLCLFTSWRNLEATAELVAARIDTSRYPLLIQKPGEPAHRLTAEFIDNPRAVLMGVRTFWTGVSIPGPACTAVVIDRLPFPSPTEPITAARAESAERAKGKWAGFSEVFLPQACLTVTQGAGRLIRTVDDQGVVVLLDPRVNSADETHRKRYGSDVLRSLPPMPTTTKRDVALGKLRAIDQANPVEVAVVARGA